MTKIIIAKCLLWSYKMREIIIAYLFLMIPQVAMPIQGTAVPLDPRRASPTNFMIPWKNIVTKSWVCWATDIQGSLWSFSILPPATKTKNSTRVEELIVLLLVPPEFSMRYCNLHHAYSSWDYFNHPVMICFVQTLFFTRGVRGDWVEPGKLWSVLTAVLRVLTKCSVLCCVGSHCSSPGAVVQGLRLTWLISPRWASSPDIVPMGSMNLQPWKGKVIRTDLKIDFHIFYFRFLRIVIKYF